MVAVEENNSYIMCNLHSKHTVKEIHSMCHLSSKLYSHKFICFNPSYSQFEAWR